MRRFIRILALITALISSAPAMASDTLLTTLGGAALGGFIGNQFGHGSGRVVATGLGAFTGGVLGNSLGHSMSRLSGAYYSGGGYYSGYGYSPSYYAPSYYYEPTYVAPPVLPPPRIVYVQPEAIEYREREPAYVQGGYVGTGSTSYCREFTQQVRIGNEVQESYGTACLQPDGSWRVER